MSAWSRSLLTKCIVGGLPVQGIKGKYEVLFSQSSPALFLMPLSTSEGDKGKKTRRTKMCPHPSIHVTRCAAWMLSEGAGKVKTKPYFISTRLQINLPRCSKTQTQELLRRKVRRQSWLSLSAWMQPGELGRGCKVMVRSTKGKSKETPLCEVQWTAPFFTHTASSGPGHMTRIFTLIPTYTVSEWDHFHTEIHQGRCYISS